MDGHIKLESFFSGLKSAVDATNDFKKVNQKKYSFDFNPLIHFYKIDENRLTNILGFFLSTRASHGQGDVFAKIFIEEFELPRRLSTFSDLVIKREVRIDADRRIDLLLDFDNGDFVVAIENKIWAGDQRNQIKDYSDWLSRKYAKKFILVYLTPFGHTPSEYSISKEELEKLSENKQIRICDHSSAVVQLVQRWIEKCESETVRQFLRDFQQFIKHTVNGNIFMNDQNVITNYVLDVKNEERLKTAFRVSESIDMVKAELLKKFRLGLEELAKEKSLTLDYHIDNKREWTYFQFLQEGKPYSVCFLWHRLREGYYGLSNNSNIRGNDEISQRKRLELQTMFARIFEEGEIHAPNWSWRKKWNKYPDFNNGTYIDIQNGNFVKEIERILDMMHEKIAAYPNRSE